MLSFKLYQKLRHRVELNDLETRQLCLLVSSSRMYLFLKSIHFLLTLHLFSRYLSSHWLSAAENKNQPTKSGCHWSLKMITGLCEIIWFGWSCKTQPIGSVDWAAVQLHLTQVRFWWTDSKLQVKLKRRAFVVIQQLLRYDFETMYFLSSNYRVSGYT